MIGLLIYVLVLLLIFGILFWAVDLVAPIPPNFRMLVRAVLALILVLILVDLLLGGRINAYLPRYPGP